jgi:hypothetical protein
MPNQGPAMGLPNAAWINFLRKYGPSAANDNMYDETIEQSRRRAGVEPLTLPTPFLDEAYACLTAASPVSVILTGTAGDGKTYYCRQLWERLGGVLSDWADDSKASNGMYTVTFGGREIHIIKDLSEIEKGIAKTTLARISKDLSDRNTARLYVIAANHGQLYEQWLPLLDIPAGKATWECIEDQLVDGQTASTIPARVFDLSTRPAAESMIAVLGAVLEHPRWVQCDTCALKNRATPCPILENRNRLLGDGAGKVFQDRLVQLMELSTQNNQHVPVRQQLMLVSNIILGHSDSRDGLMSCADIDSIQTQGTVWKATPYGNAVGENLSARKRRNREIFEKFERLGLGYETSNRIDRLLTLGASDPDLKADYEALLANDVVYGATTPWLRAQAAYLENGQYEESDEDLSFKKQMRLQRQRLFFTLPSHKAEHYGVWELTVYQKAHTFLSVIEAVRSGQAPPNELVKALVLGLNRVFTGELVQVSEALVLATAGSYSQARTNLLFEAEISVRPHRGESVTVVSRPPRGIALRVQLMRPGDLGSVDLPLTGLRFEFLSRVADGALPSSFSLECYEDILAYKSQVLSALEQRRRIEGEVGQGDLMLKFIDVMDDGRVRAHDVEVRKP